MHLTTGDNSCLSLNAKAWQTVFSINQISEIGFIREVGV